MTQLGSQEWDPCPFLSLLHFLMGSGDLGQPQEGPSGRENGVQQVLQEGRCQVEGRGMEGPQSWI